MAVRFVRFREPKLDQHAIPGAGSCCGLPHPAPPYKRRNHGLEIVCDHFGVGDGPLTSQIDRKLMTGFDVSPPLSASVTHYRDAARYQAVVDRHEKHPTAPATGNLQQNDVAA